MYPRFHGFVFIFLLHLLHKQNDIHAAMSRRQPVSVAGFAPNLEAHFETLIPMLVMSSHTICVNIISLHKSVGRKYVLADTCLLLL